MRCLRYLRWALIIFAVLVTICTGTLAYALTTADIVITATGYVVGAPGGFTIIYIDDFSTGISWIKGTDAVYTMIRVAWNRVPASRTDGYEVYYGTEASTIDTNADITSTNIAYYKAWSQNAAGLWEEAGSTSANTENFMSSSFFFIGLLVLSISLLVIALAFKHFWIFLLDGTAWVITGMFLIDRATTQASAYYIAGVLCILAALPTFIAIYWTREKPEPEEIPAVESVAQRREKKMEYFRKMRHQVPRGKYWYEKES